jgi:hypothetical protein
MLCIPKILAILPPTPRVEHLYLRALRKQKSSDAAKWERCEISEDPAGESEIEPQHELNLPW